MRFVAQVAAAVVLLGAPGAAAQTRPTAAELEDARERYAAAILQFQYEAATMGSPEPPPTPPGPVVNWEEVDPRARPFLVRTIAAPTWKIFYNLGQISAQLGDDAWAVAAFERYLALGGDDIPDARRAEAEQEILARRGKVGRLEIAVSPTDAEVYVAGQRLPGVPIDATPVRPGRYTIEARHKGMVPAAVSVLVEPGATVRVPIVLVRASAGARASAPPAETAGRVAPGRGCGCAIPSDAASAQAGLALAAAAALAALLAGRRRLRERESSPQPRRHPDRFRRSIGPA